MALLLASLVACILVAEVSALPGMHPMRNHPSAPFGSLEYRFEQSLPQGTLQYPEEKHLSNVKQLTFNGTNAEAYWSFDDRYFSFQATNFGAKCDQIFVMTTDGQDPKLFSNGFGRTTCSYFYPKNVHVVYSSTHLASHDCPPAPCANGTVDDPFVQELCNNGTYLWAIYPTYDIFLANYPDGHILGQLTDWPVYDAETTISPNGDLMVFTSVVSGDLELWTMKLDGSDKRQVTNKLGYDGGAFFSPDGKKLVFRASRPQTDAEIDSYLRLLRQHLVAPVEAEIFTVNVDGSDMQQITKLGGANWAPYYHPSGNKILFSSNFNSTGFSFNLYLVDDDGQNVERITYDPVFDSFPMFSHDGKKLVWASARNTSKMGEINLFVADWID